MEKTTFYTDGACSGNPGPGGWAAVELIECEDGLRTAAIVGSKEKTTNNEMELTAVYKALVKAYKEDKKQVTMYSDSAYVVNTLEKGWLHNWFCNGWQTKEGNQVKNRNIWEKMYKLIYQKGMRVEMVKVKGHDVDPLNKLADKLAVQEKKKIME